MDRLQEGSRHGPGHPAVHPPGAGSASRAPLGGDALRNRCSFGACGEGDDRQLDGSFRLGALDPAVLGDGGSGLDLMPRDTVEVAFDLPASQPTDTRDWFLQLTGTSTTGSVLAARATPAGPTGDLPASLRLEAPSPNPFSNGTRLRLGLPQAAMVQVEVFDLAGRRVATVVHERLSAGWHELSWNGQSRAGGHVEAGIYVCRLVAAGRTFERKVVCLP